MILSIMSNQSYWIELNHFMIQTTFSWKVWAGYNLLKFYFVLPTPLILICVAKTFHWYVNGVLKAIINNLV